MDDSETIDISNTNFSSAVFPSAEDMALWNSLSDTEKRAVIVRDEEAGFNSGVAPFETLEERLTRVRSGAGRGV